MNRKANVYCGERLAGVLSQTDSGYEFVYKDMYLSLKDATPVSWTLPLQQAPFTSSVLFPFFDGLILEGWLLDVALRSTDISMLDRMGLLLLCCKDCIGDVCVEPIFENHV